MKSKAKRAKQKRAKRESFRLSHFTNPSGQIVWRVSGTKKDGTRVRQNFKTEVEAVNAKGNFEREDLNMPVVPMLPTTLTQAQLAHADPAIPELTARRVPAAVSIFH